MKQKGFSLLELLVVMGIIGIIAAITVPSFAGVRARNEFLAESRKLVDLMLDARANAVASRVCEIGNNQVQSNGWAVRVTKDSSGTEDEYYSQLLCRNHEPLACAFGSDSSCVSDGSGGYEFPIGFYPQYVFEYLPASGDIMDRYKNIISLKGRVDRLGLIGMTPYSGSGGDFYTATLDEKHLELTYRGPSLLTSGLQTEERTDYNWFQILYTDNAGQAIFNIDTDSGAGVLAEDYNNIFYISFEKEAIGYTMITSARTAEHSYGICMNTRKAFPIIPCSLDVEFDD